MGFRRPFTGDTLKYLQEWRQVFANLALAASQGDGLVVAGDREIAIHQAWFRVTTQLNGALTVTCGVLDGDVDKFITANVIATATAAGTMVPLVGLTGLTLQPGETLAGQCSQITAGAGILIVHGGVPSQMDE